MTFCVPEPYRVLNGIQGTEPNCGNYGLFVIAGIQCIASDGDGWEHVSIRVRGKNRTPRWSEMCLVKDLFWEREDAVIQYHPPKTDYVNIHPYVLHLWRPIGIDFPRPPKAMVG